MLDCRQWSAPDHSTAVIQAGVETSFGDLRVRATAFASALLREGYRGKTVCLLR